MEWLPSFQLKEGDERRFETPWCDVSIRYRDHQVIYQRTALDTPADTPVEVEDEEELEKRVILDSADKRLNASFLPLYPDRPVVFKISDEISVPTGENGFFCLKFDMGMGVNLLEQDHVIETILPHPRKNSYWGPPNDGLLTYEYHSEVYTDSVSLMNETGIQTVVVPVHYKNRRSESHELDRVLIPTRELDVYKAESGDLVFEVVELTHKDENYQEPRPIKRPPKELKKDVKRLLGGPNSPESLFDKVRALPRFDVLSGVFADR